MGGEEFVTKHDSKKKLDIQPTTFVEEHWGQASLYWKCNSGLMDDVSVKKVGRPKTTKYQCGGAAGNVVCRNKIVCVSCSKCKFGCRCNETCFGNKIINPDNQNINKTSIRSPVSTRQQTGASMYTYGEFKEVEET